MMSKVTFISPFPLFPAIGGNRVRTLAMMRATEALGHTAHFILMPSRQMGEYDEAAHRRALGERFHVLARPPLQETIYLARRAALKMYRHFFGVNVRLSSVDETYFPSFSRQIRHLDTEQKFDFAIVQYVTSSKALEELGPRTTKIIDTHDSFFGQMTRFEERRGLLRAQIIIAIQDLEAQVFRDLIAPYTNKVVTVSHFINITNPVATADCVGATFIGSDFRQNSESLNWFIEKVLPLIQKVAPDFTITVAGTVGRAVLDSVGIVKIGKVPEMTNAFLHAPILVNCITDGTGIKIKLLEAFGAGIPVVSTKLGVEGLAEQFLRGVLVVPDGDARAFADATLKVFSDAPLRAQMAKDNLAIAKEWNAEQVRALSALLCPKLGSDENDDNASKDRNA